ncbi:aminotransferase class III-fold pyridoxal phosphate-dependent enzyme [Candidatus Bipolaricaulota bacterium]
MRNEASLRVEDIAALLAESYGVSGDLSRLPGENVNYLVSTPANERFVFKLSGEEQTSDFLELEHQAVERVHAANLDIRLPRLIPSKSDESEGRYDTSDGTIVRGRLVEFLPGTPWSDAGVATSHQLRELGRILAKLDLALADVDLPVAHRSHRWDLAAADQHRSSVELVEDSARRRLLEESFHLYAACAAPRFNSLPQSLIHGDANDENVLVQDGHIVGLLDFGDCLFNPTICELAIAIAYAMLDHPDPLQAGAEIVAGYHSERPLKREELEVIFPLICGRLSVTVAVAAERRLIAPDHPNWFVTEARAWDLLERLADIDPADATEELAAHIDLDVCDDRGAAIDDLLETRRKHISRALSVAYREPLKVVRGAGQYLYDERGRPFLDLVNNVCHVGHCHPRVVDAGQQQMERLNTNARYLYDGLTEYAERLCATLPQPLDTCFLVNSGSEANELALRLAMTHTGRCHLVVLEGGYHGHTPRLIAASSYKFMGAGGPGASEPWVHVAPLPDGYRGGHKGHDRVAGVAYGDDVGGAIAEADAPIAAFLAETLPSCGGVIIPPPGYFETAYQHVRDAGALCIADEVQVGFGRVGTHFWAFEAYGVVPDIVVMGKPIGNGHPMAAVVTTHKVAESFANGMEFFSTFGGNPVSCAIGLAVLDVIRGEKLQEHALKAGQRMQEGLANLATKHPLIGDVRGAGLFIGVELVRDRETLEPAAAEAAELVERMKGRGILLSTDGPLRNVIKMKPPMVLTEDDIDMTIRAFDDELTTLPWPV